LIFTPLELSKMP